jgi:isopenicillin-N epimerase
MLRVSLEQLGAAYYAGNCHKWLCAPKGAGFLYVRSDRQEGVVPATLSYGLDMQRAGESAFRAAFDWTGTQDPTAALSVPRAIDFVGSLLPGGWDETMARNRALALHARDLLCEALQLSPPAPDSMLGAMVAIPLPGAPSNLQEALWEEERIEVPITEWGGQRLLRVCTHLYNSPEEIERLAGALRERL